jgi:hypothetical protein
MYDEAVSVDKMKKWRAKNDSGSQRSLNENTFDSPAHPSYRVMHVA